MITFRHRVTKPGSYGPQIRHTWQITADRPRVALMLFTRSLSYWSVGLSWYGVGSVRDFAIHLAVVSVVLRLRVPPRRMPWHSSKADG